LLFAGWGIAQDKPAAAPDMKNMGPMVRQPKNSQQDQKELKKFYTDWNGCWKKGDLNAAADLVDFPVMMLTDNTRGEFKGEQWTREQWLGVMKAMMDPAQMKDVKFSSKETCFLMSGDLASCEIAVSMEVGKMKGKFNSHNILIRKDGKWKVKEMMEAGWGDAPSPKT